MRTEQLELAAYDAALLLADGDCADLLDQNRNEDDAALLKATQLARQLRS
jgi:hypothetical protein